jgi:hypothetical protein
VRTRYRYCTFSSSVGILAIIDFCLESRVELDMNVDCATEAVKKVLFVVRATEQKMDGADR